MSPAARSGLFFNLATRGKFPQKEKSAVASDSATLGLQPGRNALGYSNKQAYSLETFHIYQPLIGKLERWNYGQCHKA